MTNKIEVPIDLRAHLNSHGVETELRRIIAFLAEKSKYISHAIRKSEGKLSGMKNQSGDKQLKLDILADTFFLDQLRNDPTIKIFQYASEEQPNILTLNPDSGVYSIAIDPLDGSKQVVCNNTVGTIIGIHKGKILDGKPGRQSIVAAMYVLYGPKTTLVYCAGTGTYEFEQDGAGNFVTRHPGESSVILQEKGNLYGPGGKRKKWLNKHRKFIEELEEQNYACRDHGVFVTDINHTLSLGGGIFSHPLHTDDKRGLLRMLYELQPAAFMFEGAGGMATDGVENILDKIVTEPDQRSPIYIGSNYEVDLAKKFLLSEYE